MSICCLQETQFSLNNRHRLRVKGWKNIFQANGNEQKKKEGMKERWGGREAGRKIERRPEVSILR